MKQDSLQADAALLAQWELHMVSCSHCAEFFAASSDQILTSEESQLAQQAIMTATLAERDAVDAMLDSLREVEPPSELLQGVLRQTTERQVIPDAAKSSRHGWWSLLRKTAQQTLQRPRIAMEASFMLTSAWVLLFGVPTGLAVGVANAEEHLQTPLINSQRKLNEWQEEFALLISGNQIED
jgi:anti-sigma factor RsiW